MTYQEVIRVPLVADTTHKCDLSKVRTTPRAAGTTQSTLKKIRDNARQYANLFLYTAVPDYIVKDDKLVLRQAAAQTFPWIDDLLSVDATNHARAQARIYGHLASYLRDTRDHATVDGFLKTIDVSSWSPNVLAAILLVTSYEKKSFSARPVFFKRVVKDLKRRHQYRPAVFDKLK